MLQCLILLAFLSIYEEPFCKFVELYETPMQPCIEYAKGQISKQRFHAACCAMQGNCFWYYAVN